VVQVGQRCRPVKRDGTAGFVDWIDRAAAEGGTFRRDCRWLARLHRAGELVEDRTRARNRLGKFLLRHGRPWRGGRPEPTPTRRGCAPGGSTSPPWRSRSGTTWRWSRSATRSWTPWRPTLPAGVRGRRLTGRSPGWPPPGASPGRGALTLAAEVRHWRRFATARSWVLRAGPKRILQRRPGPQGRLAKAGNAHCARS
jgi:hypothetical protein